MINNSLKRITSVLFAITIIFGSIIAVSAQTVTDIDDTTKALDIPLRIVDDAQLIDNQDDLDELNSLMAQAVDYVGWDIRIYTNNEGIDADSMASFSNDYYDNNGFGTGDERSGIVLVIDMNSRQIWLSTNGTARSYWYDDRIQSTYEGIKLYMQDEDYYNALAAFVNDNEYFFDSGKTGAIYNEDGYEVDENNSVILYDGNPRDQEGNIVFQNPGKRLIYNIKHYGWIALIIALAVGASILIGIKVKYKKFGQQGTYDFAANCNLKLSYKQDQLIDKKVTSVHIDTSSHGGSSGGSSGSSSSSSGGSHGGGGGGF